MRTFAFFLFLAALSSLAVSVKADAAPVPSLSDLFSSERDGASDSADVAGRKDDLYRAAQRDLDAGRWDAAIDKFDRVARKAGSGADGALYWKAYAERKAGKTQAALATISKLSGSYPSSSWIDDAKALSVEIRGGDAAAPAPSGGSKDDDEELQLYALNGLLASRPERALPTLQKFLQGSHPQRFKEQALFVLSQSGTPEARALLVQVARGSIQPELQDQAMHYLGVAGGEDNLKVLDDLYRGGNPKAKSAVLDAYLVSGQRSRILKVAQETTGGLRSQAIGLLGAMQARAELRQLMQSSSPEVRLEILAALGIAGDVETLLDIARRDGNTNVRNQAIQSIGIGGGAKGSEALRTLYTGSSDPSVRQAVIHGLLVQNNAKMLIELFKSEKDRDLRREIVHTLSIMGNADAADFLEKLYAN